MDIKVTKPEEKLVATHDEISSAVEQFEIELKKEENHHRYYHLIIERELPRTVCDEIENLYKKAGWLSVKCRTSTENGERGGLTGLQLAMYYS